MKNIDAKSHRIQQLVQMAFSMFKDIPEEMVDRVKELYMNDTRPLRDIEREILLLIEKLKRMEHLVSKNIDSEVIKNSIILIGPMGVGKSTVARELCKRIYHEFLLITENNWQDIILKEINFRILRNLNFI